MGVRMDWDWAQRTGGNLSRQEYWHLVGVIVREVPTALAAAIRYQAGRRGVGRVDLDAVPVPGSTLARRAEEYVQQALSAPVLAHSYRTYFLGTALATARGVEIDAERAYLAALLHDLNLEYPTPGRCFAVTGGERAARLLTQWGADPATVEAVAAAGCGHATPGANRDLADPAGLVQAGSMADTLGARLDEIDPVWLAQLQQRYPRHNFKKRLVPIVRAEAKAVPRGRMHLINRWAAYPLMVRVAPYPE